MVRYEIAIPADLPVIAELFQSAFPEALLAVFGKTRLPAPALLDLLQGVYACEREGFWVAREDAGVVGFILVSSSLRPLYRRLLVGGTIAQMALRWAAGRYRGLGMEFAPRLARLWWDYRKIEKRSTGSGADIAQILSIVVDPALQRRGIGAALTEKALQYLREKKIPVVRLEVDAAKTGAIRLYRKFGFQEIARLPTPRGPALVMTLHLIQ